MYCTNCGKQIDDKAVVCVNCGVATPNFVASSIVTVQLQETEKKTNGFAIVGFIIGLLSIMFNVFFCISSLISLIFDTVALAKKEKYNSANGLAIAGIIISLLSLTLWGTFWIITVIAAYS